MAKKTTVKDIDSDPDDKIQEGSLNFIDSQPEDSKVESPVANTESIPQSKPTGPLNLNEEFYASLKKEKEKLEFSRASSLSEYKKELIVEKLSSKLKLTKEQTVTALAILFQQGGTTKRCDGNLTTHIFGKDIKLSTVRAFLKTEGVKGGERKLARSLATSIQSISSVLELPGNLAKLITRNNINQEFTISELAWMSDFQVDNQDCPEKIRKLINEYFNTRKQTTIKPKKK